MSFPPPHIALCGVHIHDASYAACKSRWAQYYVCFLVITDVCISVFK